MSRRSVFGVLVGLMLTITFSAPAGAGESLSKPEYIKAADDICRQANILRDEVAQGVFGQLAEGEEPTFDQLSEYVADVQPVTQQEIDSLRALPAPDGDKKRVKKIYKLAQKGLNKIVADPHVLLSGPAPFAKADKAAQKYGFEICGSESTD